MEDAYGGFIFACSEDERETLPPYIRNHHSCSVTINNLELKLGVIELCLFSLDQKNIQYAALMRRAKEVVSARYSLKSLRFVKINPVSLGVLENIFSTHYIQRELFPSDTEPSIKTHIMRTTNSLGKRLPPNIWEGIIAHLKTHSSGQARDLDDLERIRQLSHKRYESIGFNVMKQEKDATLLALRLFGAEHENVMTSWFTQNDQPEVYLQGLEGYRKAREDDTIIHDIIQSISKIAPEIQSQPIRSSITGVIKVLGSNGQTITIINANRNQIEDTTGVDLVYYNHAYRSHVMVQYKMMEAEFKQVESEPEQEIRSGQANSGRRRQSKPKIDKKEFFYRPDPKFDGQLQQMKRLQALASEKKDNSDAIAYRLNNSCFFFKLCESFEFEPLNTELAQGLYLPLDYMEMLLASPNTKGPRGGTRITHANAGHHFSNSLFMDLIKDGFIGSSPGASKAIYEKIHSSLSEGRSLTLAWANL